METDTKILYIRRLPAWLEFIVVDAMKKHDMKEISNSKVKEKQSYTSNSLHLAFGELFLK